MRLIDENREMRFLDNRWLWPRSGAAICALMSTRPRQKRSKTRGFGPKSAFFAKKTSKKWAFFAVFFDAFLLEKSSIYGVVENGTFLTLDGRFGATKFNEGLQLRSKKEGILRKNWPPPGVQKRAKMA
jgi:hypothetical protein